MRVVSTTSSSKSTPTDLVSEADVRLAARDRELIRRPPTGRWLSRRGGRGTDSGRFEQLASGWSIRSTGRSTFCSGSRSGASASPCATLMARSPESSTIRLPGRPSARCAAGARNAMAARSARPGARATSLAEALVATGFAYDARGARGTGRRRRWPDRVRSATFAAWRPLPWTSHGPLQVASTHSSSAPSRIWDTAAGRASSASVAGLEVRALAERPDSHQASSRRRPRS